MSLTSRERRKLEVAMKENPLVALLTFGGDPRLKLVPGEVKDGMPIDTEDDYDEFGDPWGEETNGN